jgi:large subunit ribosomal protein L22
MAREPGELATQANARARYVGMSPFKLRQVAALIRGKPIDEARRILAFTPKAASRELSKVLEAAVANAEQNFQIPQDELVVKIARADEGPTLRRFRPRALGRAYRVRKRTSHIDLVVERVTPQVVPGGARGPRGEDRRRRRERRGGQGSASDEGR